MTENFEVLELSNRIAELEFQMRHDAQARKALADELAYARDSRDAAERQAGDMQLFANKCDQRAIKAEAERDDLRADVDKAWAAGRDVGYSDANADAKSAGRDIQQRLQATEADNAALLARLHKVAKKASSFLHAEDCGHEEGFDPTHEDYVPCSCAVGLAEDCAVSLDGHPGAALLAELEAARGVVEAARTWSTLPMTLSPAPFIDALAAHDAVKK